MKRYALIFLTLATVLIVLAQLYETYLGGLDPSRHASQILLGMLVLMCASAILALDIVGAFLLFRTHKLVSLLPLLLMLGSCALHGPTYRKGFDTRIDRFKINQSRFEEVVSKVKSREIPDFTKDHMIASETNYVAFRTPDEYSDIVPYLITANWENDGTLTVRCVLTVSFPNPHHRTYIYRPDGHFTPYLRSWERMDQVITTNWAAIHD